MDNNLTIVVLTVLFIQLVYMQNQSLSILFNNQQKALHKKFIAVLQSHSQKQAKFIEFLYGMRYYFRLPRSIRMKPRSRGFWKIFRQYRDDSWYESFRINKKTFFLICDMIGDELKPCEHQVASREPLSAEEQLAITLYYLASISEYRIVGDVFGIHKSTVWKCIHKVCDLIIKRLMPEFITMPSQSECEDICKQFERRSQIPQIILALDGSHIPITPTHDGYLDYINRKNWPSLVLQAAVDSNLLFRNINCESPGCSHDALVFKNSNLYLYKEHVIPNKFRIINGVKVPYIIVADPAYPLLSWLMKDFVYNSSITPEKDSFNVRLNKARVVVEMAFGRLKARWRRLLKKIDVHVSYAPTIIACCCVLHNIAEKQKNSFIERWLTSVEKYKEEFEEPISTCNTSNKEAETIRNALVQYLQQFPLLKSLRYRTRTNTL